MSTVSRGSRGRRRPSAELPPGQCLVEDVPVLSAGPTPGIDLADRELVLTSETDPQRPWTGTACAPCPPSRSKLGTTWEGVAGHPAGRPGPSAGFALVTSWAATPTNLAREDLVDHQAWIAFGSDGAELEPEHGGPARLLVPTGTCGSAPGGPRDPATGPRRAGVLGAPGLPPLRRPLPGATLLGRPRGGGHARGAAAGLPDLHPHQVRHTFADSWLSAGGNEGDLMRLVGWRSRHMVDRYAKSTAE